MEAVSWIDVTAIVFWPAAPFFLFMHGKDITVPKGTEITAYINGNVQLDAANFESDEQSPQVSRGPATSNGTGVQPAENSRVQRGAA